MGSCFTRCHSNLEVLENSPESDSPGSFRSQTCIWNIKIPQIKCSPLLCGSAALQESVIVSLHDYPMFEDTEPIMFAGERLLVVSE